MSLPTALHSLISILGSMLQTRLELVTVELEEELLRFSRSLIYSLIALFCGGVAVSLGIFLVVAVFWDEHRIAVLTTLMSLFTAACLLLTFWIKLQLANKPRLLEQSLRAFRQDAALFEQHLTEPQQTAAPQDQP